jgi:hypothetical protein
VFSLVLLLFAGCGRGERGGEGLQEPTKGEKDHQTMMSFEEELEEKLEKDTFEKRPFDFTGKLKERYAWEEGGDAFLGHFRRIQKGWTLEQVIEHSGLPAPYEPLEAFVRTLEKKLARGETSHHFTYGVPPPAEGGFYYRGDIEITDGKVDAVKIDWGHLSVLPGAEIEPVFKRKK